MLACEKCNISEQQVQLYPCFTCRNAYCCHCIYLSGGEYRLCYDCKLDFYYPKVIMDTKFARNYVLYNELKPYLIKDLINIIESYWYELR